MTTYLDRWVSEHGNFRRLLDELEGQIKLFHRGNQPDYGLMLDVVYFMTNYPDRFHHPVEDMAFELLAARHPSSRELVDRLLLQHQIIAESGMSLQRQLDAVSDGLLVPRSEVEQPARIYVDYYREHLGAEEKELFPLARQVLTAGDWVRIGKEAPHGADPLFGGGVLTRYRQLHAHIVRDVKCECAEI